MVGKKNIFILLILGAVCLVFPAEGQARIKLAALPERGKTLIRLEHPQATLVQEERVLTLQQGLNTVDFSWKGVRIDEDSIRLDILDHGKEVNLLSVSYPPNESALVWKITSQGAFEVKVRISYLLAYIDRLIAYRGTVDREEKRLHLKVYLILRNFSGEDFEKALVVPEGAPPFELKISHEETKQCLILNRANISIDKRWTFDAARLPWDPEKEAGNVGIPVSYRIRNEEQQGLGDYTLAQGKVRLYQDDGQKGMIFLGEDKISRVPVGEVMEITIGDSRDLVVTQKKMKEARINVRRDKRNRIVLYDTDEEIRATVENFKDKPARLTMIQHIPGQWDMEACNMTYKRKDAYTLEFEMDLAPHGKRELLMNYHRRNLRGKGGRS